MQMNFLHMHMVLIFQKVNVGMSQMPAKVSIHVEKSVLLVYQRLKTGAFSVCNMQKDTAVRHDILLVPKRKLKLTIKPLFLIDSIS